MKSHYLSKENGPSTCDPPQPRPPTGRAEVFLSCNLDIEQHAALWNRQIERIEQHTARHSQCSELSVTRAHDVMPIPDA